MALEPMAGMKIPAFLFARMKKLSLGKGPHKELDLKIC